VDFPFTEKQIGKKIFLREFKRDVVSDELIWHMDREDRYVKVVEGKGWELQLDNQLPKLMEKGKVYFIPSYTYHRVIKGDTNLIVEIKKC
jgi:quercetin dioxygenase-like cupin family protein